MNCSKILVCVALAIVSSLVSVQAGRYSGHQGPSRGSHYVDAMTHYPSNGCHNSNCGRQASRGPYGPYHSYAVKPVIYGGRGMYQYRGYARLAQPQAARQGHGHLRYARSYGLAPRRHNGRGCRGYNCAPARNHYQQQLHRHYEAPSYSLRAVHAIALINNYPQPRPTYHHGGYRKNVHADGGERAAAHGASHYDAASREARQHNSHYDHQRHGRGGY